MGAACSKNNTVTKPTGKPTGAPPATIAGQTVVTQGYVVVAGAPDVSTKAARIQSANKIHSEYDVNDYIVWEDEDEYEWRALVLAVDEKNETIKVKWDYDGSVEELDWNECYLDAFLPGARARLVMKDINSTYRPLTVIQVLDNKAGYVVKFDDNGQTAQVSFDDVEDDMYCLGQQVQVYDEDDDDWYKAEVTKVHKYCLYTVRYIDENEEYEVYDDGDNIVDEDDE